MKPLNDITLELQTVAPHLAQIARINTLCVPQNYFEQLPNRILELCRENDELKQEAPTLFKLQKTPVFETPTGYFDLLYDEIIQKNTGKIATEATTHQLDQVVAQQSLSVPPAYFDQLHDNILAKIRNLAKDENKPNPNNVNIEDDSELILPNLNKISKKNPFAIPQNYFEHLHERVFVQTAAAQEDETEKYPSIDQIASNKSFKTPQNYFNQLHDNILNEVKKNQTGRLIEMQPQQSKIRQLARYLSSAAAIAVLVAGYQLLNNNNINNSDALAEAKIIPMEEIMATINELSASDVKGYVNDNPDEFDEFLDDATIIKQIDLKKLNANDFTQDISTDDIKSFVNSNMDEFDDLLDDQISDIKLENFDFKSIDIKDIP